METIKYLSNPCSWFINGSNQVSFVYEGGDTLYHFNYNVYNHIVMNVVFFANSIEHAKDIIERMIKVRLEIDNNRIEANYQYYNTTHRIEADLMLEDKDNWIITEAPKNQFYKVGWACNDTIL
jgi:hypothetical protein